MFSICLLFKIALIMFRSDNKLIFFWRKKTTRNAIFENRVNRVKISIQCTWPSKAASIVLPVVKPVTLCEDKMFSDRFLSSTILQLFLYDFFSCMRWFWNDFFFYTENVVSFLFLSNIYFFLFTLSALFFENWHVILSHYSKTRKQF